MSIKTTSSPPNPPDGVFDSPYPGVYEIFVMDRTCLSGMDVGADRRIYIGKSLKLMCRGHFDSENTGWSTLRRSLGAMLKEELGLEARPRRTDMDCTNYQFDADGEGRLTMWMLTNLKATVHVFEGTDGGDSQVKREVKKYEDELIQKYKPPLNIREFPNHVVEDRRKLCREECKAVRLASSGR